jgi:hypothetical protein
MHVVYPIWLYQTGATVGIVQNTIGIDGSKNIFYSGNRCPGCSIFGMEQQKQAGMKSSKA